MPTSTYRVADFLKAARKLGVRASIGSEEHQALADYTPGETLALDFRNLEASTARIRDFAEHYPIAAILSLDDQAALLAAHASRSLHLPGNPVEAARAVGNKFLFRERCAGAGILTPPFVCHSIDEPPEEIASRASYPCVLKPLSLAGSRGVIRADTGSEFVAAFGRLAKILRSPAVRRRCPDTAGSILVEAFIPGREFAVDGILSGGKFRPLAIFDKPDPMAGPFFEETIYITPARLSVPERDRLLACLHACVAAIDLREGPVHAEFRMNDQGVWPIDMAARSIGGLCSRSLSFGEETSLEEVILMAATAQEQEELKPKEGASGVMMIPIPGTGILQEVRGVEKALKVEGIHQIQMTVHPGQQILPLPEGNHYLGFLFARGEAPPEVEESLRKAHRLLEFVILPEGKE